MSGPAIASGTVVIRNGLIEAVGAIVTAPADAQVIDGSRPDRLSRPDRHGQLDRLDLQVNRQQPRAVRTTEEAERWKRDLILRPAANAADHLQESPELARLASAGITSVLSTPPGVIVKGRARWSMSPRRSTSRRSAMSATFARGIQVVRTPVALHIEFPGGVGGDAYPVSLIGVISFVRQSFLDAQHQQAATQRAAKTRDRAAAVRSRARRAAAGTRGPLPVAFEVNTAREIMRVLRDGAGVQADPVISGGREADQVTADLKARNVRVIYNLNYPTRRGSLAPDADESIDDLQARAQRAAAFPAALDKAGVTVRLLGHRRA